MPWAARAFTIAGVAGSVKVSGIDVDSPPTLYFSSAQAPLTDMTLAIRSSLAPGEIARDVARITAGIDRDQPVYDIALLQERIDRSLKTRRFVVWLMLVFAVSGTGLAALGLYGLLAYTVTLRRREIGIRMALGAGSGVVAMLVCREGMAMVAAGVALGSVGALGAYRLIAGQMYGVGIADGSTWLAVLGIVCAAGAIATACPAWRVTRISPAEALRAEQRAVPVETLLRTPLTVAPRWRQRKKRVERQIPAQDILGAWWRGGIV